MPPKRSAAPPPPPPEVSSSAETGSGSGSEEEDDEEIAHSPPPAAPKSIAPPPQKDQESDASDEDEDGEEEDEDEDEGEEEGGEDEDEKANHVIPSSTTKNPLPPAAAAAASREESDSSDEEEEEEAADEEMPQAKSAPNQEMEAKGAKKPSGRFQRSWSTEDEVRILEVLAAHRLEHGTLPKPDVLANALDGKLDRSGYTHSELQAKVKSLQSMHIKAVKKGDPPSKDHARRIFDLCKNVWPSSASKVSTKAAAAAANSGAGREPDEMCKLYPYLAEEVNALQKTHPGLFKREFAMIDDSKARALNEKIKKVRHTQMNLHMRRHGLIRDVTKTLMDMTE